MDEDENVNTLKDLIEFFSTEERPVTPTEFRTFWNSCSEAEKQYYKTAKIK